MQKLFLLLIMAVVAGLAMVKLQAAAPDECHPCPYQFSNHPGCPCPF